MTERVTYAFDVFIVRDKFNRELYRVPYSVYQQMHELMTHPEAAQIIKRVRSLRTLQAQTSMNAMILLIDEAKCAEIRAAIERARDRPIPWDTACDVRVDKDAHVVKLADRPPGQRPQSEHVQFSDGMLVAISFEYQPAGLLRHISVLSAKPGTVPHPAALAMIMNLFGVTAVVRAWFEEFGPDHYAINYVQIEPPERN